MHRSSKPKKGIFCWNSGKGLGKFPAFLRFLEKPFLWQFFPLIFFHPPPTAKRFKIILLITYSSTILLLLLLSQFLKYIIITWPSLWMFIVFFTRPSGVCSLVESTCIYILCLSSLKITRPSKLCETQLFRLWVDSCEKLVWVEKVW